MIVMGSRLGPARRKRIVVSSTRLRGRRVTAYGQRMARVLLRRDAEMTALSRQVDAVRAGSGRVIVVAGPAGIGKSSLLAATAKEATACGVRVLRAWGGPLEHEAGWGIARQLF